ncbi:hypothetical protein COO91_02027 [Nostoc flagelliforme CCNUN1]|uniref:Uncharacterized protein n=1 Tax=Nostoc flagelliforme CCNUN1 TaxID=2038116 RepID=A0A2K8SKW6_9NOSO|nr:hypothetical protein [Nostoc flagelliforme]AUB36126.1 hypothetical protein COO91_02027 [Nostoc flagelliforme CCNUN1]
MTDPEFPNQIFLLQKDLLQLEQVIATTQGSIKAHEAYVECAIACDETLKNDQQRKAKKLELDFGNEEVRNWRKELIDLTQQRGQLVAELEYARNLFTVWKLAERRAIAELEVASDGL